MALLSRLHWWTVEYGLIGTLENPKIYGAGLLSSIGESVSCLEPKVKKIPYSIDAAQTPFDITTKQPQLFVCRDFQHLSDVLEEFASKMAFRVGGLEGINKAIECKNVATCEYSSGLQVSGVFTEVLADSKGEPIYLRSTGPSALAFQNKELSGHGRDYHKDGFGSPIGTWKETELREGESARLEFESGVTVEGKVEKLLHRDGKLLLITFSSCTAKLGDRILFDPAWGTYDMAVGEKIVSVFNGAADKDAYNQVALVPKERTIKASIGREAEETRESVSAGARYPRAQDWLRAIGRDLGNATGRTPRRLAALDGDFRNPRRAGRAALVEAKGQSLPRGQKDEDEGSFHFDQLGFSVGGIPQARHPHCGLSSVGAPIRRRGADMAENRSGLPGRTRQISRQSMKQALLLVFAAVALCLSSCAMPPSIGQQTLEQQQKAQEVQNSEKFAHGLQQ